MSEIHEIRECRERSPDQLADLYSAGKLIYGKFELFDLFTSQATRERLARYLPEWMDRGDIQWSYMGYSFKQDLFVIGFNGATGEGTDVDGYYLFKIEKDHLLFQGLGLIKQEGLYGKIMTGLQAMYPDLVDLQRD